MFYLVRGHRKGHSERLEDKMSKQTAAEFVTEQAHLLERAGWTVELKTENYDDAFTTVSFFASHPSLWEMTCISGRAFKSTRKGSRWAFKGVTVYPATLDARINRTYRDAKIAVQVWGRTDRKAA